MTDADGNALADGTVVNFNVSGDRLGPIGSDASSGTLAYGGQSKTKAGTASASVRGSTGATAPASLPSSSPLGGEPHDRGHPALLARRPSKTADVEPVDGLSQTELNNFASWSGEGSVSASELLAGIADATGVLYYDGDSWQRYGDDGRTAHPWLP